MKAWSLTALSPLQEVLALWGGSFAAIILAFLIYPAAASFVAAACFLYLPLLFMRPRDEDYRDYGLTLVAWRQDLLNVLVLCAILGPLFFGGFYLFAALLPRMPPRLAGILTPLHVQARFHPRLPKGFALQLVGQPLAVALPEEFFYRGYLQQRLRQVWPQGAWLFGVRLGPAFFVTAALFALGHLAIFQAWRLWVFFPALLFGWLRERTGTVVGATAFHALCNLFEQFLEASFA